MSKLCPVCSTENRDEAQFCRACGTAFTPAPAAAPAAQEGAITCDECGFQNPPGQRYCANCGVSLLGTVIVPRSRAGLPGHEPVTSPPPLSYPSYAPVAPYPPAPPPVEGYPPVAPAWPDNGTPGYASEPAYAAGYPPPYPETAQGYEIGRAHV